MLELWAQFGLPAVMAVLATWILLRLGARSRLLVISLTTLVAILVAIVVLEYQSLHFSWRAVYAALVGVGPLAALGSVLASRRVEERFRKWMPALGLLLVCVLAPVFAIASAVIVLVTLGEPWPQHPSHP